MGRAWQVDSQCDEWLPSPAHLILNSTMANTGGRENFNPAYDAFRKHSADLLTVIQDAEVLAWELYAENIISVAVRDAANNMMHERGKRTSDLLAAVESKIKVNPGAFDVFLSVLAKRPSMSDLCGRMKDTYGKLAGEEYNLERLREVVATMTVPLECGTMKNYR